MRLRTRWLAMCLLLGGGTPACGGGGGDAQDDGGGADADADSGDHVGADADADADAAADADFTADDGTSGDAGDDGSADATDEGGEGDAASSCTPDARSSSLGTAVFAGSTVGAPNVPRESECPQGGPEALLEWTAPRSGYYRFDTIASRFDTVLSVRRACDGAEVSCNDDGVGIRSSLTLSATEGETLLVTLDGATGTSSGEYSVDITEMSGPQCDAPGYSCHDSFLGWRVGYVEDVGASCAALFADEPFRLYESADLVPGAHACECRCGAPWGGGCLSQLDCDYGAACVAGGARDLSAASCLPLSFGWDTEYSCQVTLPIPADAGHCDSGFAETVHDAPTWSPRSRFCSSTTDLTPCEPFTATVCQPRVPPGRTECIAQSGERSCPTPYAGRTVFQAGLLDDARGCDAGSCGCGPAVVTSCDCSAAGTCAASFYTSDTCSFGSLVQSALAGECTTFRWLSSIHSGRATLTGAEPITDDCAVTGAPGVSGAVRPVPENVVTVCCKVLD